MINMKDREDLPNTTMYKTMSDNLKTIKKRRNFNEANICSAFWIPFKRVRHLQL